VWEKKKGESESQRSERIKEVKVQALRRKGIIPSHISKNLSGTEDKLSEDGITLMGDLALPQYENKDFFGIAQEAIFGRWLSKHVNTTCKGKMGAGTLRNAYVSSVKDYPWVTLRDLSHNIKLCDPNCSPDDEVNWGYFILKLDSNLLKNTALTRIDDPNKKKRTGKEVTPVSLGHKFINLKEGGINWALMRISRPVSTTSDSSDLDNYAIIEIVAHKVTKRDLRDYKVFEKEATVVARPLSALDFRVLGVRNSNILHLVSTHGLVLVRQDRTEEYQYNEWDVEELVEACRENLGKSRHTLLRKSKEMRQDRTNGNLIQENCQTKVTPLEGNYEKGEDTPFTLNNDDIEEFEDSPTE
jgi:hypothetical protein